MNPYSAMAPIYDEVNAEIDYARWADYIEEQFRRHLPAMPELVLDLAAGTGSMTIELAKRGYDMTAVDLSADMLSIAADRIAQEGLTGILLLQQDMTAFELYGTVDAVVCCLDSLNHLTGRGQVTRCFKLVHNYLNPGGLFLFDVNTPHKFAHVYGDNDYILDTEDGVCCWRNRYDTNSAICQFALSVFTENADGSYTRTDTVEEEKAFTMAQIEKALKTAGFTLLAVTGDYTTPAREEDDRWHFVARCEK